MACSLYVQAAARRFAIQAGNGLSIGLPLLLAARDLVNQAQAYHSFDLEKDLTIPAPAVEEWVQKQIAEFRADAVSVRTARFGSALRAMSPRIIVLHAQVAQYVENMIHAKDVISVEKNDINRAFFTFGVMHELGHLENHDVGCPNEIAPLLWRPLLIQAACFGYPAFRPRSVALLLAGSLFAGVSKYIANLLLGVAICRSRESRADAFACERISSPHILYGAERYFVQDFWEDALRKFGPRSTYDANGKIKLEDAYNAIQELHPLARSCWVLFAGFMLDPRHPHPLDRARNLRQAAKRLEAQQQQDSVAEATQ